MRAKSSRPLTATPQASKMPAISQIRISRKHQISHQACRISREVALHKAITLEATRIFWEFQRIRPLLQVLLLVLQAPTNVNLPAPTHMVTVVGEKVAWISKMKRLLIKIMNKDDCLLHRARYKILVLKFRGEVKERRASPKVGQDHPESLVVVRVDRSRRRKIHLLAKDQALIALAQTWLSREIESKSYKSWLQAWGTLT